MGWWDAIRRRRAGAERRFGPFVASETDEAVIVAPDATWALRESDYPFWGNLRARLREHGIDPNTTMLVESYEQGATAPGVFDAHEVGVLVTADKRVISYRYSYKDEQCAEWDDLTDACPESEYADVVARALGVDAQRGD